MQLDMNYYIDTGGAISANGIHAVGNFATLGCYTISADWTPSASGSDLIALGNNFFQISLVFPGASVGDPLLFKFVNGNSWSGGDATIEGIGGITGLDTTQCAQGDGYGDINRVLIIPPVDFTLLFSWDHCGVFTISDEILSNESNVKIFPNPLINNSQIFYSLLNEGKVVIALYDARGACVRTLVNENVSSGEHITGIDATNLSPGIYYCSISSQQHQEVVKMVIQK